MRILGKLVHLIIKAEKFHNGPSESTREFIVWDDQNQKASEPEKKLVQV